MLLVDGKLVENLHVENAHRVVAMADAIAAMKQSSGKARRAQFVIKVPSASWIAG